MTQKTDGVVDKQQRRRPRHPYSPQGKRGQRFGSFHLFSAVHGTCQIQLLHRQPDTARCVDFQMGLQYSTGSGGGLVLENPFIRTENGRSYVYTVGEDDLLEKRYIRTGRSMWGSYTEILGGLSPDGYVAFPYGRQTKEGAPVRYAEADELWNSVYGIG